MEEAERRARVKGATAIELNVWEFNVGALAFYDRLGYKTRNRRMDKTL
jgi:ribosomal protein S18 acetylase RimI-like enzyme